MKIMIADDQARRYGRVVTALVDQGVSRDDITMVVSANDARTAMEKTHYDLLILDILLPLWNEEEPDARHSLDLLVEIHEGDLQRPRRILGITADLKAVGSAPEDFASYTWTVIQYSDSNDEWLKRILSCVEYIVEEVKGAQGFRDYGVDLAIVCALAKPELEEVLRLPWNWSVARPLDDVTFVHDGYFQADGRKITVCATAAPRMGMVATALSSSSLIDKLRPRLLAMCGICAGVEKKVSLGDVLLADPAWDYQSGKRVRDRENTAFSISPNQLYTSAIVRTHVEQIRGDREALAKIAVDYPHGEASGLTQVHIGPVASGSAVLADGKVIDEIKLQHRDLIGIEMEAYGLYAAAHNSSSPQPHAFAMKSVCDFADPDKDDRHQRYAAYASANVLRLLMERFGPRILSLIVK